MSTQIRRRVAAPRAAPVKKRIGFSTSRRRRLRLTLLAATLVIAAWALWELRVLLRPLYMLVVVRYPALLSLPLLAAGAAFALHLLARTIAGNRLARQRPSKRRPRNGLRGSLRTALVAATVGFAFAAAMTGYWTQSALYQHTTYETLDLRDLESGQVRIKPYAVAMHQTQNGLSSPTERPSNLHIVKVAGRLSWTSVRDPEGLFRILTRPTRGVMSVDATSSRPRARFAGPGYDANFRFGPGMRISENIRWQIYKWRCYTCDIAELIGLPAPGGPLIVAPYLRYEGSWFVRRPVFGGVYVVHPSGRIDDLSPRQALRDPVLRASGRIVPEKLARQIADAYGLKRGVANRLFVHEEELHVADTEQNRQPFFEDLARIGTQWVTTLKPRGQKFATAAIMTTDALSGRTRIWHTPRHQSLIGNQRALDIVRGETIPGIVFAAPYAQMVTGRFRVIEPRQVIAGGRLHFLCSVIPDVGTRVTMSVLVDAESQQLVRTFPATPQGDAELAAYLHERPPGAAARHEPTAPAR